MLFALIHGRDAGYVLDACVDAQECVINQDCHGLLHSLACVVDHLQKLCELLRAAAGQSDMFIYQKRVLPFMSRIYEQVRTIQNMG